MTRPQIIRADTIDLQDPQSPSAQDHTKQPSHPGPPDSGHPSPHQAETLRQVAEEQTLEQHQTSPRISQEWIDQQGSQDQVQFHFGAYSEHHQQSYYDDGYYHAGQNYEHGHDGFGEQYDDEDREGYDEDAKRKEEEEEDAKRKAEEDAKRKLEEDDTISSSPSIDDEDIDFEFVYALHSFEATIEGQANATKGDTMVLLDDSNSYWWLVRVVKDGSIGYLPAEHIETPTERLARLNKHRNIDLSQTMLGDNPEKSKNPLKKAMRRRNAKTVQFTDPTYVEASDVDFSSDEEDVDDIHEYIMEEDGTNASLADQDNQEGTITVQPLKVRGHERSGSENAQSTPPSQTTTQSATEDRGADSRTSDEIGSRAGDAASSVSRNGVVRNTDSFFKDDNVETRKITLTPNLLRDDSNYANSKTKSSPDTLERLASPEKTKDDRRKKERKSGVLSGLFKRKDKRSKGHDDEEDDMDKSTTEYAQESANSKGSEEFSRVDSLAVQPPQQPQQAQRQPGKLQKPPPPREQQTKRSSGTKTSNRQQNNGADQEGHLGISSTPSMRLVEPEPDQRSPEKPAPLRVQIPEQQTQEPTTEASDPPRARQEAPSSSLPEPSIRSGNKVEPKQQGLQSAHSDVSSRAAPSATTESDAKQSNSIPVSVQVEHQDHGERLSESPVEISPLDADLSTEPPHLVGDTSSQEEPTTSLISPSSPEPHRRLDGKISEDTPISTASSLEMTAPWSFANLKAYFDDDRNVRDLLLVVHDKTGVKPVTSEHPMLQGLFGEERKQLAEMNRKLDNMLHEWLAKRPHITAA
ncbi:hypothetical protein L228DRAFT_258309 [Xylona heveae TC161]|uniref:SH3 domain-containing protein n=1 Tax=Xylona heveae (strain CBS 132557 / TC161) TaxID=1328760 RepID=A0A165K3Y2_XYLHT|nr:hypothetical protein L228DRAFT_258309 [Xylona heveae TC161]KZF26956.1 hypothetical protein L228DRAFT_258309 [Xylona heveae TC161]